MKADCKLMREQRPNAAFSLIELMVVIGIIALLGGILVPAVEVLREKGKETACANNIRQWGQAMSMYLDEHRGVFPTDGTTDDVTAWYNVLPPYIGVDTFETLKGRGKAPCPGIGKSIYICPAAPIDSQKVGNYASGAQSTFSLSYALNYWISAPKQDLAFSDRIRLSQIRYPDAFVVFSEPKSDGNKTVAINLVNAPTASVPAFWHRDRVNVSFADGHVAPVRRQDAGAIQWNPHFEPGKEPTATSSED